MGHHAIGALAYDLLDKDEQSEVMRLLAKHPDFDRLFAIPEGIRGTEAIDRWRIGTAGNWPDMIRGTDADRPTWHYQLGASLVLGDKNKSNVPADPGALPDEATLVTTTLHIAQAYELCSRVLGDESESDADRAIALCWLCHLVADGHQPCHAGSLYAAKAFPDGDRGGNFIKIGEGNLHATWDNLLGTMGEPKDIPKLLNELRSQTAVINRIGKHRAEFGSEGIEQWVAPDLWLAESRAAAVRYVYTEPILLPVYAVMRGLTNTVAEPKPDADYFETAARIARVRAVQASYRLSEVLKLGVADAVLVIGRQNG